MSSGLLALLDDVAAIAKLTAASVDDLAGAASKVGAKAAGVVIDDAAVTPSYVVGLSPDRELPIIGRIALGSLRNKLLILLPAALLLSAFAPWAILPLLMLGGAFLCFEAAEKVWEKLSGHGAQAEALTAQTDMKALEDEKIASAVRTDLILSAEIMAIALAQVMDRSIGVQAAILAVVSIGMTVAVYGAVALIVKMDDIGLKLAHGRGAFAGFGRGLVRAMPGLLQGLGVIGTAAMAWVGGGIIVHGLEDYGLKALPGALHGLAHAAGAGVPALSGFVEWLIHAAGAGLVGLIVGAPIVGVVHQIHRAKQPKAAN
jgi:uncharacterized protein